MTRVSSTPSNPKKKEKSPRKAFIKVGSDENNVEPIKPIKISKKIVENETAADKLFKQITSGLTNIDHRRKEFRRNRFGTGIAENVDFGSDDNCDSDEQSLVIADPSECLAAAVAQANRVKNPRTPKTSVEKREEKRAKQKLKSVVKLNLDGKEKKKRAPLITAYTLFARENRSKIHNSFPELDFANVSRRLGETWQAIPAKEKLQWKKRAQKLSGKGVEAVSTTNRVSSRQPNSHSAMSYTNYPTLNRFKSTGHSKYHHMNEKQRVNGTGKMDIASHLALLGESLSNIGQRLSENPSIPISGSLSVLLDSTLCAIGPLVCLTRLDEITNAYPKEIAEKILDNISYIMPGI